MCGLIIIIIVIIINITNVPDPVYNIISGQFSQAKKHLENLQMNKNTEALNIGLESTQMSRSTSTLNAPLHTETFNEGYLSTHSLIKADN